MHRRAPSRGRARLSLSLCRPLEARAVSVRPSLLSARLHTADVNTAGLSQHGDGAPRYMQDIRVADYMLHTYILRRRPYYGSTHGTRARPREGR